MANTLCAVTHKLGGRSSAVAIDSLRVATLRCVGLVGRGGEAQDVRPLLELLGIVGVAKSVVGCSVEATQSQRLRAGFHGEGVLTSAS